MLCHSLQADGHQVVQSEGDGDMDIVSEMFKLDTEGTLVTVIADDTDIFVLLLLHFSPEVVAIYIHSKRKKSHGKMKMLLSIHEIAKKINSYVLQNLPVIHAWGWM